MLNCDLTGEIKKQPLNSSTSQPAVTGVENVDILQDELMAAERCMQNQGRGIAFYTFSSISLVSTHKQIIDWSPKGRFSLTINSFFPLRVLIR